MSFDAITLKLITLEIKDMIIGRTIDKVIEPRPKEFIFIIRNEYETATLGISINPNMPALFYSRPLVSNFINSGSNYSLVLKKYLEGARIESIGLLHSDRILFIKFTKKDSFCEKEYNLVFEFMGKHSNGFIYEGCLDTAALSDKNIIAAYNKSENLCQYISKSQKTDIMNVLNSNAAEFESVRDKLVKTYTGISPMLASFINTFEDLKAIASIFQCRSFSEAESVLRNESGIFTPFYRPALYSKSSEKGIKTYVYPFKSRNSGEEPVKTYESVSGAYCEYYSGHHHESVASGLLQKIRKLKNAAEHKMSIYGGEIEISKNYEEQLQNGKILLSLLSDRTLNVQKNENEINAGGVIIPIDCRYSVSENAQRYFKNYKRSHAKYDHAKSLFNVYKELSGEAVKCYESVRASVNDGDFCEFDRVESKIKELALKLIADRRQRKNFISGLNDSVKLFKSRMTKKKARVGNADGTETLSSTKYYRMFLSSGGFQIYVGKSDEGNDHILSKVAVQEDYWFHVRDFRGSSVILKLPKNIEPDAFDEAINEAALYAAYYSQGRNATKIFVSCAQRKHVKKVKRALGKVTYSNEKTILIDISRLEEKFNQQSRN